MKDKVTLYASVEIILSFSTLNKAKYLSPLVLVSQFLLLHL